MLITEPIKTEISHKIGRTPSLLTFLLADTTNPAIPTSNPFPLPQPMNQFRFHEEPQTKCDNDKLSTDLLFYPQLTTITSIPYNTITRPCMPGEASCISAASSFQICSSFVLFMAFITQMQKFSTILSNCLKIWR